MDEQVRYETYNYSVFEGREDFVGFRSILKVGMPAPDFTAIALETDEQVRLSDYDQATLIALAPVFRSSHHYARTKSFHTSLTMFC